MSPTVRRSTGFSLGATCGLTSALLAAAEQSGAVDALTGRAQSVCSGGSRSSRTVVACPSQTSPIRRCRRRRTHRRRPRPLAAPSAGRPAGPAPRPSRSSSPSTTRRPTSSRASRRLHAYLSTDLPVHLPDHDRRQRQHRRHAGPSRRSLAAELPGVRVVRLRGEGPRPGAAARSGRRSDADRRSPTWTSTSPPTSTRCCRWWPRCCPGTATWRSAPGWRRGAAGRPRAEARGHLALLQPAAARRPCAPRFSDAQCGFKAIRADVARALLPLVEDTGWFFDTELLVLAERAGLRIHEVPVDWVDDPDSPRRHRRDRAGRPARHRPAGRAPRHRPAAGRPSCAPSSAAQLASGDRSPRQAAAGSPRSASLSTLAYLLLFLLLRAALPAQVAANLLALLLTARRRTPPPTAGSPSACAAATAPAGTRCRASLVFALGLALTSRCAARCCTLATPTAAARVELGVLVVANARRHRAALRRCSAAWVFARRRPCRSLEDPR